MHGGRDEQAAYMDGAGDGGLMACGGSAGQIPVSRGMRQELEQLLKRGGGFPALDRWARRWRVGFKGTVGFREALQQALAECKRREKANGVDNKGDRSA